MELISRRVPRRRLELPRPDGHWILNIARARREMKTRIRPVSGETTFVVTFRHFSGTENLDNIEVDTTTEGRHPESPPAAKLGDEGGETGYQRPAAFRAASRCRFISCS